MVQLILTIISIALAAAAALVTVNYTPWWTQSVADAEAGVRTSLRKLETVYIASTRATAPDSLVVAGEGDGGLMANFGTYLGFTPGAPRGYTWSFGRNASPGAYANMHYFCMQPESGASVRDELTVRALTRASRGYSPQQFIVGTSCGAVAEEDLTTSGVPVLTFYVHPLPDVGL